MFFYEVYDSDQSKLLYPVNYLRNYARMQVRTRLLAMVDVDMYLSASLSAEMEAEGRWAGRVTYKRFYEPWFITCEEIMPWYDVDFRGYGMNKIILIAALNYYNYSFWIHPAAWLVHNPHTDTEVRKVVAEEASQVNKHRAVLPANALYRKLTQLFGKAKRGMMRGSYTPRTDPRQMAVYDVVRWLPRPPQLHRVPLGTAGGGRRVRRHLICKRRGCSGLVITGRHLRHWPSLY
eukprot:XP_001700305.1 predicted protein [Chlamydomonas reinhardtii]